MPRFEIGLAGWGYPEWAGPFYSPTTPPGERLRAYARVFPFVEADSTYYQAPTRADVTRWARLTPAGFRISPKLPARIVKEKLLEGVDDLVQDLLGALAPLRAEGKLGPVLAQLPPSFRRAAHGARLEAFLDAWPRDTPLAVETRHASWWTDETFDLLRARGAIHVWATTEYGRTPPALTARECYLRLIGDRALDAVPNVKWDRVRRDQSPEMAYWAEQVRRLQEETETVWIIANNHFTGYAPDAAHRFAELIGARPPELAAAREGAQRGLGGF